MQRFKVISLILILSLATAVSNAQSLPFASPNLLGIDAAKLSRIDNVVNEEIKAGKLPGAVIIIGRKGKIVYRKAFGYRSLVPAREPMTIDTVFDLASLTKPLATALSVMILVEDGRLRLSDTIGKFIPDIEDERARRVTILELLTHTSGYAPDFDLKEKWSGREGMLAALRKERLKNTPGTVFTYSDIGYIVLGEIVERASGEPLDVFVKNHQFATLLNTSYRRISKTSSENDSVSRIAPTEDICGQMSYLGSKPAVNCKPMQTILRGKVHDPTAFRMDGVAGHAGLFSTADDLALICQMLLDGGRMGGRRILSPGSVARMNAPVVVSETGSTRGLGWDINTAFSSNRGDIFPLGSFGHTGFTGTSVWIDPVTQTFVIFLSNRVHPDGKGDVTALRAKVSTIAASAINDIKPLELKRAESFYQASVAAQISRFKENLLRSQIEKLPIRSGQAPDLLLRPANSTVLNGIDVLEKNGFRELKGKRVGLITNHTGRNLSGRATIDILFEARDLTLAALFSPEHGIRGELDVEKISDSKDEKTGLPIYSLYGDTRRPKPEQLAGLDALVYDIQDVGARFYTYTATLRNVLEEAAKAKIPVFVLDRPNPINGLTVEGPISDADKLSFIAAHTIPVRYGLTIGELAQMMNTERSIGADLRVIKMSGWSRGMWFDETGQTWVNPSPNMRSLTEAALYPGIGLLETTNLSVGRGTDTPFEVIGAPWLDGRLLAGYLNSRGLEGVRFVPVRFKPISSVYKDQMLGGINIIITNRSAFRSVRTGLEIAAALYHLYPREWEIEKYGRLLVNAETLQKLRNGESPEAIESSWNSALQDFEARRRRFLLY